MSSRRRRDEPHDQTAQTREQIPESSLRGLYGYRIG